MDRKKLYLIILLSLFFVLCLGAGIYVLITSENSTNRSSYRVNRYQDTINWCDTGILEETLSVDCKGLLLHIRSLEDGSSCFDVQVITKDKELKEISVCEEGEALSYTNEILEYKKLMPIDIVFSYAKEGVLKEYSLNSVSLTKLEDSYVQGIVNEDIANLVNIGLSSTTIQNSVNFCPRPETLPNYVTEENKTKYSQFYAQNRLNKIDFQNSYIYNIDDSIVRVLFACDSMIISGYSTDCIESEITNSPTLLKVIKDLPPVPNWDMKIDENALTTLKKLSLLYDSMNLITISDKTSFTEQVIESTKLYNRSEEIFCATNKLIGRLKSDKTVEEYKTYTDEIIAANAENVKSAICESTITKDAGVNIQGLYVSVLYKNIEITNSTLMNRCYNFNLILK